MSDGAPSSPAQEEACSRDTPKTVARLVKGDEGQRELPSPASPEPAHERSEENASPSSDSGLSPDARERKKEAARKACEKSCALYESAVKKDELKKKAEMDKKTEQEVQKQVRQPHAGAILMLLLERGGGGQGGQREKENMSPPQVMIQLMTFCTILHHAGRSKEEGSSCAKEQGNFHGDGQGKNEAYSFV